MKAATVAACPVVSPVCLTQGVSSAGDRFRVRENIVETSGPGAGFTYQQH